MIYGSVEKMIGNTPLVELSHIEEEVGANGRILAKLEGMNPGGSAKDRVAKQMLDDAEKKGLLNQDTVIIEATSGNTGIGLAMVAASRGYRLIIVMPETMSLERRKILSALGAELVLTDGKKGMTGSIEKAEELKKEYPNHFVAGQFVNPSNPKAHVNTTGPEIYEDTEGKVDIFVSSVGTGGTLTGVGKYLKGKNPKIQVIAVEPEKSPVLSGGEAHPHGIQGIGAGFIPEILDTELIDEIIQVSDEDAYETGRLLGRKEGILCGISSGATLYAAIRIAKRQENKGKNIVVLLPDTGERYLSTPMFS